LPNAHAAANSGRTSRMSAPPNRNRRRTECEAPYARLAERRAPANAVCATTCPFRGASSRAVLARGVCVSELAPGASSWREPSRACGALSRAARAALREELRGARRPVSSVPKHDRHQSARVLRAARPHDVSVQASAGSASERCGYRMRQELRWAGSWSHASAAGSPAGRSPRRAQLRVESPHGRRSTIRSGANFPPGSHPSSDPGLARSRLCGERT
jgi:hypothetical protein